MLSSFLMNYWDFSSEKQTKEITPFCRLSVPACLCLLSQLFARKVQERDLAKKEPYLNWKNCGKTTWESSHKKWQCSNKKNTKRNFFARVISAGKLRKIGRIRQRWLPTPELNLKEWVNLWRARSKGHIWVRWQERCGHQTMAGP